MAMIASVDEPLDPATAKRLANQALVAGRIILDDHVRQRMAQRKVTLMDVHRVLRAGAPQQGELDGGTFRYPITTPSITVCYAFRRWNPITILLSRYFDTASFFMLSLLHFVMDVHPAMSRIVCRSWSKDS